MPVHLRLNDKDTSRNPYINFVTALPGSRHDEALQRLQQLAAMAKPLMSDQGFHINSLEEYEWNKEFAGRCWNNGEVIELVLTRANGEWIPLQYVLYVFCHELAHIKHMNHIPHLHGALTKHLKDLALQKQRQGYFGDGLWSAGRSVGQGSFVGGLGMQQATEQLPEHVCGGAFSRTRAGRRSASARRRRRGAQNGVGGRKFKRPSLHTGAQTASNTRGGNRRVKLEAASSGAGRRVDGRDHLPVASAKSLAYKQDDNSTFRKRTQTKDARELRASAALARIAAANGKDLKKEDVDDKGSFKRENDFANFFTRHSGVVPASGPSTGSAKKEEADDSETESEGSSGSVTEDDENYDGDLVGNDLGESAHEEQYTQGHGESADQRLRRMNRFEARQKSDEMADSAETRNRREWQMLLEDDEKAGIDSTEQSGAAKDKESVKRRRLEADVVKGGKDDDIIFVRHKGNAPKERSDGKLGGASASAASVAQPSSKLHTTWSCKVCTLENERARTRCQACDTTKGQTALGA